MATIFGTYSAPAIEKDENTQVLKVMVIRKEDRRDKKRQGRQTKEKRRSCICLHTGLKKVTYEK